MPFRSLSRALPAGGTMLAVLAAAVALAPPTLWSYDSEIMAQVAHSIVSDGGFRVYNDSLNINAPYASYGIGMSLLMVLPELLSPLVNRPAAALDTLINPVVLALIAGAVWLFSRRAGATPRQASAVALILALATPLLPYGVSTFSEEATALGVAVCLLGLQLAKQRPLLAGVIAGAGVGVAGLMRQDSFVMIAPVISVGVLLLAARKIPALAGLAVGVLPAVLISGAYNAVRFGSPFVFQYQGRGLEKSFVQPFWTGFYGLTASPGRGILWYAPLVVVMVIAWRWTWQRSPVIAVVCAALLLDRILFYSTWWAWHAGVGWGPRFLIPALPALAPFLVEIARRLGGARVWAGLAFGALVAVSLSVQVAGAVTNPGVDSAMRAISHQGSQASVRLGASFMEYATSPEILAAWTDPLLDWSHAPIPEHLGQLAKGENIFSKYLQPGNVRYKPLAALAVLFVLGLAAALQARRRPRDETSPVAGQESNLGAAIQGSPAEHL